ncbi:hypothetical protein GLAREA_10022 [Glarea lozoyensis ATCC 20868]|uniref:Uncharacterized protein n=1 Tax=Glarea lozoyensis (strain ATCC 20868 / MF5171) TaxID=1116229 RepID=S3E7N7_GLAL2|nr:uncharacterized protein GLAREA_10022 [Glarea lozoyensis ATCC 20868]EPE34328.1 hypothetical protein GLAREA_10022 [Glarea lozoyensis ATCC 20868]
MRKQFSRLFATAWLLGSVFTTCDAATSNTDPSLIWTNPDGRLLDFDTKLVYRVGDLIRLSWNAWPYENVINSTQDNVDLWLTADQTTFTLRLTNNIDLLNPGSFDWTIDVPAVDIDGGTGFFLRFMVRQDGTSPPYDRDAEASNSIRTPGFHINEKNALITSTQIRTATFSSTVSRTATASLSTSTRASSSSSSAAATTAGPPAVAGTSKVGIGMSRPSGLSEGAKAGIGAGVGIGVSALFAIAALLWFINRRRKAVEAASDSKYESVPNLTGGPVPVTSQPGHEKTVAGGAGGVYRPVSEVDGDAHGAVEVDGVVDLGKVPGHGAVELA